MTLEISDGNLMLTTLTSNSTTANFLRSQHNTYANGHTFKVLVTRAFNNISMRVQDQTLGDVIRDHVTIVTHSNTNNHLIGPNGTRYVYFGGDDVIDRYNAFFSSIFTTMSRLRFDAGNFRSKGATCFIVELSTLT